MMMPIMARAEIDLYGTAHVSVDYIGNGDHDPANRKTAIEVTSNQSNIGLRGREGLRDRLALIWQAEQAVDLDDGEWGDGRDSYVGLETSVGSILAGRYATPYRRMSEKLDVFADTRADYNATVGAVDGVSLFNQRARNILLYTTPEDKRLRFSAAYIANQERDDLPLTDDEAALDGFSLALVLDSGPLYLGLAYERLGQPNNAGQDDADAQKAALGWDFGQGTQVAFIWEEASDGDKTAGSEQQRSGWYLNLSHISGNVTYKVAYGMVDELKALSDSGAQMVALGFSYALSRRTDIYLLGAGVINEDNGLYGLQPDQDDPDSAISPQARGNNVYAVSGGLIHRFDVGL